jgi:para-nitrobenzyl esterase
MKKGTKTLSVLGAILLMAIALSSCDSGSSGCDPGPKTVHTQSGDLRALDNGDSWVFRGIPYAAPPVGELRWKAPQDPKPWSGVRQADEFGDRCPQPEGAFGAGSLNEDCLYLNVTTPKGRGPFPVMVWIHGGAFIAGSGSEAGYDPTRLVQEDVVVVTFNYRLGALGFLPHPALTAEAGDSGNYGLLDQQKALQWVKNNIAAFDGNPNNVTIFGESAGGHSVLSHIAAPSSQRLFNKAVVQSGAYSPTQLPLAYGYAAYGIPFTTRAGCAATEPAEIRAFMRDMTVEEVLTAQANDWYVPVTGGALLPVSVYEALSTGKFNKVPVLSGCNLNEGRLFVALDMANGKYYNTAEEYVAGVSALLATDPRGLDAARIADDYIAKQDSANPNKFRLALSQIWTDYFFSTNNYLQWNQLSALTATYAYWFTDVNAPNTFESPYLPMDATHSLEIQYVFGTVGAAGGSEAQVALSEEMVGYWTRFAKFGAPEHTYKWKPFAAGDISSSVKKLDTPTSNVTALDFVTAHNCAYWGNPPVISAQ